MAVLFCPPLAAQDNPLVQRGVPAEATADNAVAARDQAYASARRIAYQRMAEAMGISGSTPSDSQLDSMVAALIVEQERTTPTRYSGRLTVQFAPGRVASATGRSVPGQSYAGTGMPLNLPAATQAYVEAASQFNSFQEWLEIRRRLRASGIVANMEIMSISTDAAQYRLGLRQQPSEAASALGAAGIAVSPSGGSWQVGLGGG